MSENGNQNALQEAQLPQGFAWNLAAFAIFSLLAGLAASLTGSAVVVTLLDSLGAPKWAVGACLTCGSVGVITRLWAPRLSARFRNTKLLLIAVGLLCALPTLGYGLLVLSWGEGKSAMLVVAFAAYWALTGLVSGLTQPTGVSFQHLLFGKGFMRAQGWGATAGRAADIVGGLFLVWLLGAGGMGLRRAIGVCFIAAWALRSAAWAAVALMRTPQASVADAAGGSASPVADLVGLVMENRFVRDFVWVTIAARWASDVAAFFLLYAFEIGFKKEDIGYYKITVSAAGILSALAAGRLGKRFGEFGLTRLCYFIWPVGILFLPLLEHPWAVYPAAALFTAGGLLSSLALTSLLMANAPHGKKTLAAALLVLIPVQGTQPMSIFFGFLGDLIGLKWLLVVSGLLFFVALRKLRHMEQRAATERDCGAGTLPS